MIGNHLNCLVRQWSTGAGMAAAAGVIGMGTAHADSAGDLVTQIAGAGSGNQYDPAVFDYSADPSSRLASVYTIQPTGAEDVQVTTPATGTVYGTQEFTLYHLGTPVDTFTGSVEYTPLSGLAGDLGGYSETITTAGSPGTLLPESTGFLIDEYGLGYGNVFEESMNSAGTSATVGDFVIRPFGDKNITRIVDLFLPKGAGINDSAATSAAAAAAPASGTSPADVLSDASTNYTDASQALTEIPSSSAGEYTPGIASAVQFDGQMVQGIANMGSAESALSSYDNGVLAEFLNPMFNNIDQSWDQASEATLAASQAVETAADSGSTTDVAAGLFAVSGAEFEALGPAIHADFIDLAAHFLTGGDFTSIGDIASGLDPASAIDPSMFTDLLSSIGL